MDGVTIPLSRSVSKEKERKVIDEINIHTKAQEIACKILDLKKQRRQVDKDVKKLELELEKLFDSEKIESIEIDMGVLTRRKKVVGYEWLIEM